MFVHFERATEQITSLGPIARETAEIGVLAIPSDLGRKIVLGQEKIQNYFVYRNGDRYYFERSQDVVDLFVDTLRNFSLEEIKTFQRRAECSIILNHEDLTLTVRLNTFLNKPIQMFKTLNLPSYKVPIYVTRKNDPTYLLAAINPVVSDIVQKYSGEYTYRLRELPEQVSIYTKPIFKTYSLEIL
jgi:hypothetical protein